MSPSKINSQKAHNHFALLPEHSQKAIAGLFQHCRNQEALFPVVCWTVLQWVVPRNDQMHGIQGKAGSAPAKGCWERREVELRNKMARYSWKNPFAFGSSSTGRYQSTRISSYMFQQTYRFNMTNQLPWHILFMIK